MNLDTGAWILAQDPLVETPKSLTFAASVVAIPNGPLVVGPDLGGSQILRVGGTAHVQDLVVTSSASGSGIAVFNTNAAAGFGIFSKGGGADSAHFLAKFVDANDNAGFAINGDRTVSIDSTAADVATLAVRNTSGGSVGLLVSAGGITGRYIAQFQNFNNVVKFVVDDPAGQTGVTSLQLFVQDSAALARVRTGPAGSGPGGSGRALYVA
jgi:hypothetical protein